jgi:hypothetical protein
MSHAMCQTRVSFALAFGAGMLVLSSCGSAKADRSASLPVPATAAGHSGHSGHSTQAGSAAGSTSIARQADVAVRGKAVMGFDLEVSTHRFTKNSAGGVEQVVANNPGDTVTINEIRAHVSAVAKAFSMGDFSSPIAIHGEAMPGLATLRTAGPKLNVTYRDLPNGSEVTYQSDDRVVIEAIGLWFDAQLNDHGQHAVAG